MDIEMASHKSKPKGRPSSFTQAIADTICERLANGESLRSICEDDGMPDKATVFRWLAAEGNQSFRDQYARARELQADTMVDDMLDIADDGRNDWMEKRNGDGDAVGWQENGEALRRSALRIDARKWMAGKLQPKKYGDKLDLNHSGSIQTMSEDQVDARLAELLGKAGISPAAGAQGPAEGDE